PSHRPHPPSFYMNDRHPDDDPDTYTDNVSGFSKELHNIFFTIMHPRRAKMIRELKKMLKTAQPQLVRDREHWEREMAAREQERVARQKPEGTRKIVLGANLPAVNTTA